MPNFNFLARSKAEESMLRDTTSPFSKITQASKNLDLYTEIISPLGSSPIKRSKFSVR